MKNLVINYQQERLLEDLFSSETNPACHFTDSGSLLCWLGNRLVKVSEDGEIDSGEELDIPGEGETGSCVRLLELDEGSVIMAFEKGHVFNLDVVSGHVEEVGKVEGGLEDIVRSPDDDLLLLITRKLTLVIMTREFDPLTEIEIHQDSFGTAEFVNVGWGKKETQFHGSAGKEAAKASTDVTDQLYVTGGDDRKPRLVWREDGQFFAVSYITPDAKPARRIRVFDREGVLQSTSEPVIGLGHSLAWKPSGALIASSQITPTRYQVAFFERNGLRHGEFTLPFPKDEMIVKDLEWNKDSSALMVYLESLKDRKENFVQVYTSSNYHWSLKQSFCYSSKMILVKWDSLNSLRFHSIDAEGRFRTVQLGSEVTCSSGKDLTDLAYSAVVDGQTLKVTPFRQTVIPPPMSAFELKVNNFIKQVFFHPSTSSKSFGNSNSLAVVDVQNKVRIFIQDTSLEQPKENGFVTKSTRLKHFTDVILSDHDGGVMNNFCWMADDTIIAASSLPSPCIKTFKLALSDGKMSIKEATTLPCEGEIFKISRNSEGTIAAIELIDGEFLKYSINDFSLLPWENVRLPASKGPFNHVQVFSVDNSDIILALSDRHQLYLNGTELCSGVTSFVIHSDFLMVTTSKHVLRCLPLKECVSNTASLEALWSTESVRSLERGSKLVTAVSKCSKTILQMPRGNLEVIHPRSLVLHVIRDFLDEANYREAMEVLRRHRINLNVLVDHDPEKFLSHVDKFVGEITDIQRICLFIADLSNEDCTKTLYSPSYSYREDGNDYWQGKDKVDTVCRELLSVLSTNEEKYILPILSCLIKQSSTSSEDALERIISLRDKNPKLAEEALQFLLLLIDVNVLFDVALGMYDFDIVLFVAEKSQKDPKEFLPFLNELRKLPSDYMRFKIDLNLKKYEKALSHLSKTGDLYLKECLDLVKSQRLYKPALNLFQRDTIIFKEVSLAYGEYLMSKKYYEEAAIVFQNAKSLPEALEAWEKSLNWKYCLAIARSVSLSDTDFQALCQRLIRNLVEAHRYKDAGDILKEYLKDEEEAVANYVKGHHWSEAFLIIQSIGRDDLMDTHFKPTLLECARSATASIENKEMDFDTSFERLKIVLETKRKIAQGLFDEVDVNVEDADLYSDTTSLGGGNSLVSSAKKSNPASLKTRNTQRSKSSKNRRKNEKKKYSTREGSSYEDVGLISFMHEVITSSCKMTDEIKDLNKALTLVGQKPLAISIQNNLSNLIKKMIECSKFIWKETGSSKTDVNKFGPEASTAEIIANQQKLDYSIPWNIIDVHLRYPPKFPMEDEWQLEILKKSS